MPDTMLGTYIHGIHIIHAKCSEVGVDMPILQMWNSRFKMVKSCEIMQLVSGKTGVQTIPSDSKVHALSSIVLLLKVWSLSQQQYHQELVSNAGSQAPP